MKTAKQIKVNNRVKTVIECTLCGATTSVNSGIDTKTAKKAFERACKACSPVQNPLVNKGWWLEFGLSSKPYVYGPMPRMRTSQCSYRLLNAFSGPEAEVT